MRICKSTNKNVWPYRDIVDRLLREAGKRCGSFSQLIAGRSHVTSPTGLKK